MDHFFFVSVFFLFPPAPLLLVHFLFSFSSPNKILKFCFLGSNSFYQVFFLVFFSFISFFFFFFFFSFLLIGRSKLIFFQRENEFCNQEINIFVKKKESYFFSSMALLCVFALLFWFSFIFPLSFSLLSLFS